MAVLREWRYLYDVAKVLDSLVSSESDIDRAIILHAGHRPTDFNAS